MYAQIGIGNYYPQQANACPTTNNCPGDVCPDIVLKRHDTKPPLKILMEDCNGPMDLTDELMIAEVSMWTSAKLKTAIDDEATYFQLADNVGFDQIMIGDIIMMDRVRLPEYMLVTGFDESNHLVQVERGYRASTPSAWKKGTQFRIFRILGGSAEIETVQGNVMGEDGVVKTDQILETYLVYNWQPEDTCTPGCFWLEFKLLKMVETDEVEMLVDDSISNISFTSASLTPEDFGCMLGEGVEWVRRFPSESTGFLIKITDSFTPG